MEPPPAKKEQQQQQQQQQQQPTADVKQAIDVKTLATKAVVAYTEFLTSVAAAATPTPDAKTKPADAIGGGAAKFQKALTELREEVAAKRRKIEPVQNKAPGPASSTASSAATASGADRTASVKKQQEGLSQSLAAISAIVEKLEN